MEVDENWYTAKTTSEIWWFEDERPDIITDEEEWV